MSHAKQAYLDSYEQEHKITMKVLRAYPKDKVELRPHAKCKTARELAWVFVAERMLGTAVLADKLMEAMQAEAAPAPDWDTVLSTLETAHVDFGKTVAGLSEAQWDGKVKFYTAPKTVGEIPTSYFLWFMLHDQIHHRGQFSIYLRMADAKVPSIYGPTADEPWG